MTATRISLDMEAVLADVHPLFLERYNDRHNTDYTRKDITDWYWVKEKIDYDEFMDLVDTTWKEDTEEIPVHEPNLPETLETISTSENYVVDILTGRTGVETEMQEWLEHQGITQFSQFQSTNKPKSEFEYDIYVDDNPTLPPLLPKTKTQYLIIGQNPWALTGTEHDRAVPIETVAETVEHILNNND